MIVYLSLPLFVRIEVKGESIITVLKVILGNPLRIILSSLRCHTSYVSELIAQVDLKPLTGII